MGGVAGICLVNSYHQRNRGCMGTAWIRWHLCQLDPSPHRIIHVLRTYLDPRKKPKLHMASKKLCTVGYMMHAYRDLIIRANFSVYTEEPNLGIRLP